MTRIKREKGEKYPFVIFPFLFRVFLLLFSSADDLKTEIIKIRHLEFS